MKLLKPIIAVTLPLLLALPAHAVSNPSSTARSSTPTQSPTNDPARVCQRLRATGATDVAKVLLALTAKLPKVPADDVAIFAREKGVMTLNGALTRRPLFHVWLAGRYLQSATEQIGMVPDAASLALRSLMLADSANTAAGFVSIATEALLFAATDRSDVAGGKSAPSDAQLREYTFDLQQISLTLHTLVTCSLRQPG